MGRITCDVGAFFDNVHHYTDIAYVVPALAFRKARVYTCTRLQRKLHVSDEIRRYKKMKNERKQTSRLLGRIIRRLQLRWLARRLCDKQH